MLIDLLIVTETVGVSDTVLVNGRDVTTGLLVILIVCV